MTADDNSLVGSCDVGYSCAYSSTLSWLTPTLPLMAENNPRVVFERLFGSSDSTDPRVRASRLRQDRSILDSVTERVQAASAEARAHRTTRKVSDYLESLRDVERRIQKAEEQSTRQGPELVQPAGVPDGFRAARGAALRPAAPGLSVGPDARHHLHVRPRADRPAVSADRHPRAASSADAPPERPGEDGEVHGRSRLYHVALFASYLEKLARDAGWRRVAARSRDVLLRRRHQQQRSPHARSAADAACSAGARGRFKGGRHLVYPDDTPLTNLQLTLLDKLGVPAEKLGDSTGQFTELSEL